MQNKVLDDIRHYAPKSSAQTLGERDMKQTVLVVIVVSLLTGCTARQSEVMHEHKSVVSQEFLSEHGFWESEEGPGIFSLLDVRLGDASRDLGFALSDLRPTPSQPDGMSVTSTDKLKHLPFCVSIFK